MLVVDASFVFSALVDRGPEGTWATDVIARNRLAAPHLLPVEVTNVLRRSLAAGDIQHEIASIALGDLGSMKIELFEYAPFSRRVWELRSNLTPYDAWYVAVAEELGAKLATLDTRLRRAAGPRCRFETPTGR
jgi:predicted nucleic acid-binding protein